jgi:hypothetical protein
MTVSVAKPKMKLFFQEGGELGISTPSSGFRRAVREGANLEGAASYLKARGLVVALRAAVGDGALGFWD